MSITEERFREQNAEAIAFLEEKQCPYEIEKSGVNFAIKASGPLPIFESELITDSSGEKRLPDLSKVQLDGDLKCKDLGLSSLKGIPFDMQSCYASGNNLEDLDVGYRVNVRSNLDLAGNELTDIGHLSAMQVVMSNGIYVEGNVDLSNNDALGEHAKEHQGSGLSQALYDQRIPSKFGGEEGVSHTENDVSQTEPTVELVNVETTADPTTQKSSSGYEVIADHNKLLNANISVDVNTGIVSNANISEKTDLDFPRK